MKRLNPIFLLLFLSLAPALYSLEEKQFQAKIVIQDSREPELLFPLSLLNYDNIKESFLERTLTADFHIYEDVQSVVADAKDLCGIQEPIQTIPEGDIL